MQSRLMYNLCGHLCGVMPSCKGGLTETSRQVDRFLDDYPTVEELEGDGVFGTIRSQVTICCGMNAAPPPPPPPGGGPGAAAAAGASGASGGGGGGGASAINDNTYKPKLSAMPKNF